MWQVSNRTRACFLSQHLNHVNSFLLFRNMSSTSSSHKIVGISSHVNLTWKSSYIFDESSQHLTSSITLHQSIQLSNSGTQSSSFDLSRLKENQRTFGVSTFVLSRFSHENNHSTLGWFVTVVSESCIRHSYKSRITLNWPEHKFHRITYNLPAKFVQVFAITYCGWGSCRSTTWKLITWLKLSSRL